MAWARQHALADWGACAARYTRRSVDRNLHLHETHNVRHAASRGATRARHPLHDVQLESLTNFVTSTSTTNHKGQRNLV